jgi:hypothetical protein
VAIVTSMQSLMRKSLLVSILMLPNILTHLESLDEQLPAENTISRDYGVSTPLPEINISFNPRDSHLLATVVQEPHRHSVRLSEVLEVDGLVCLLQ